MDIIFKIVIGIFIYVYVSERVSVFPMFIMHIL